MKQYKARDKITQKMTRDGAIEVNAATGKQKRISKRAREAALLKTPEQQATQDAQAAQPIPGNPAPDISGSAPPLPHAPGTEAAQDTGTAERVLEHIDGAHTRRASKKAARKAQAEAESRARTSRLQFTEEERATPELQPYIKKSDKAADRLDEARAKIPKEKKLVKERTFDEATGKGKTRLRFEEREKPMNGGKAHKNPLSRPAQEAGIFVHNKIHSVEKDNSGVEGAHKSEETAEKAAKYGARKVKEGYRSHKLKPYRAAAKAEKAAQKANANYLYQKAIHDNPQIAASNPFSRYMQKQRIKKQYAKSVKAQGAKSVKNAAENTRKAAKKTAEGTKKAIAFVGRHPAGVCIAIGALLLFIMISSALSSCGAMFSGMINGIVGTSYTSEDADLVAVENNYAALETDLQRRIDNIERDNPGYDEYRYDLDSIGHNPHELASYLTALLQTYTPATAQAEIQRIFELQYTLTLTEEVEIRYRTETSTDPDTGETTTEEVPYEYYILNVTLKNYTLPAVIFPRMDEQQKEIYTIMQELKGNKPYLWEGIYTGGGDPGPTYEIPGEALSDPSFAALMAEATKYIGYPYVWGGSSPSTSFDCSGFVCWVYTASGVHNLPRTTAQGIYNQCAIIPSSEAKPGDIIFFTGTYDSPGPVSHVGIYVGDNKMLHCGDPIQYADITSSYWTQHFYAFGRLS